MDNQQIPADQNPMVNEVPPQQGSNNSRSFLVVAMSVLLTAMFAGSAVYFWQRSANERTTSSLEQKIVSLEEQISTMKNTTVTPQPTSPSVVLPPSTTDLTANLKTYTNDEYGFSFTYPQSFSLKTEDWGVTLTNIAEGHKITISLVVTGGGYCYRYGERKEIVVGGKVAETADGIYDIEMCGALEEDMSNNGNTFVLIPLDNNDDINGENILPPKIRNLFISYSYPLVDLNRAKSNLDQILSSFKFIN